jgi:hypothetical protein
MNKQQIQKLENIKKKVACPLSDCGQHFTFTINEFVLALAEETKRIYRGKCSKCQRVLKLKQSQLGDFQSVYGKTNYVIEKSKFTDIFEINEDK